MVSQWLSHLETSQGGIYGQGCLSPRKRLCLYVVLVIPEVLDASLRHLGDTVDKMIRGLNVLSDGSVYTVLHLTRPIYESLISLDLETPCHRQCSAFQTITNEITDSESMEQMLEVFSQLC